MHVERYGCGPQRALGLHGWSGDHTTFEPLLAYLPSHTSLYAPDLPGCGRSPAPAEWRLECVADEIARLMEELAGPRVTLIGNCSGGLLGLCATLRLMERAAAEDLIERIVLIDPLAYWPWYFRVFASKKIGRFAYACSFANPAGRWVVNLCLANRRQAGTNLTEGFQNVSGAVLRAYLDILGEIEGPEKFKGIGVPITILHGEHTFGSVRRSAGIYRGIWPQAKVIEVTGAGHLPLIEAPEAVADALFGRSLCRAV